MTVTPTYSGCPAHARDRAGHRDARCTTRGIERRAHQDGVLAGLDHRLDPDAARAKLRAYGIAPPAPAADTDLVQLLARPAHSAVPLLRLREHRSRAASSARPPASRSAGAAPAGSRSRSSRRSRADSRQASAWASHARATRQSRLTVAVERSSAAAVSSTSSPPKNRHSTTAARRLSTFWSSSRAS